MVIEGSDVDAESFGSAYIRDSSINIEHSAAAPMGIPSSSVPSYYSSAYEISPASTSRVASYGHEPSSVSRSYQKAQQHILAASYAAPGALHRPSPMHILNHAREYRITELASSRPSTLCFASSRVAPTAHKRSLLTSMLAQQDNKLHQTHRRGHSVHDILPPHEEASRQPSLCEEASSACSSRSPSQLSSQNTAAPALGERHFDLRSPLESAPSSTFRTLLASGSNQGLGLSPYPTPQTSGIQSFIKHESPYKFAVEGSLMPKLESRECYERLDIAKHDTHDVLDMITHVLDTIVSEYDRLYPETHSGLPLNEPPDISPEARSFRSHVLSFHGCNIPAISIQAYLLRLLKYCPATSEIFISQLVYFDRINRRAEKLMQNRETQRAAAPGTATKLFWLDSYNIHRLIVAGVTVAAKFFSDIFYKNTRYAKVGGVPFKELNYLELQFLVLTDFNLLITVEELQQYADFLLNFRAQQTEHSRENSHRSSST